MSFRAEKINHVRCGRCKHKNDVSGCKAFSSVKCTRCGGKVRVPVKAGEWIILRQLGSGSYSRVYLGYHKYLMRPSAIKVPKAEGRALREIRDELINEAQAMACIDHENVVNVYGVEFHHEYPLVTMEYIEGGSLRDRHVKSKRLSETETLRCCIGAAHGLQAAARGGLVHRDIKPGNILLTRDNQPKVADFGLSCLKHARPGEVVGTPFYVSPEVVLKETVDHRADIYSLGCMMFHLISGRHPFTGNTVGEACRARLKTPAPRLRSIDPRCHVATEDLLIRMLRRDPDQRIQSYELLIREMTKALEEVERDGDQFILRRGSALDEAESHRRMNSSSAVGATLHGTDSSRTPL